jgi:PAS domain S-box-containing protein
MNMRAIDKTHEGGFPYGGGTMGALIRALDWSRTSLGPLSDWPPHLKATIDLMLPAKAEIVLFWGPDFIALYNDAYAPTIGHKHPRALGRPARENWEELWDDLEPLLRRVLETGETVFAKDRPFYIERRGYPENVYFDISYSAVRDGHGAIGGVLCIVSETTERVVAQQKLAQAQERLTQALNASGMVGTFDWHVQTDKFYSDARFAGMFSVDPARAVEGAPLAEYAAGIHPDDVERVSAAMKGTVATGTSYHQEYRLRQKDGTVRWVDVRGECLYDDGRTPIRFVGVVIDITKQKEAQDHERLLHRETNHRLKNLFAMLDALVSLSAKSARTPAEFASALRGRFNALLRAKGLIRPGIIDPEEARRERATVAAIVQTILRRRQRTLCHQWPRCVGGPRCRYGACFGVARERHQRRQIRRAFRTGWNGPREVGGAGRRLSSRVARARRPANPCSTNHARLRQRPHGPQHHGATRRQGRIRLGKEWPQS